MQNAEGLCVILFLSVCWDGWYGENCATACGQCKDGTPCLKTTGHCISGCDIGYGGDTCNHGKSLYACFETKKIIKAKKTDVLWPCLAICLPIHPSVRLAKTILVHAIAKSP